MMGKTLLGRMFATFTSIHGSSFNANIAAESILKSLLAARKLVLCLIGHDSENWVLFTNSSLACFEIA